MANMEGDRIDENIFACWEIGDVTLSQESHQWS